MFKVGPNPYGICYTLGIQGNASAPKDALWFLGLAESMRARCIEFHFAHLAALGPDSLEEVQRRLKSSNIEAVISGPWPLSRLHEGFTIAKQLGVKTIRTHLSPILCGARAAQGEEWYKLVAEIRQTLPEVGSRFSDEGFTLAIENHQDFGSEELLEFCYFGGSAVGICLDTGNPLAVGEDPVSFARRVSHKVCHLHLKDYRVQPTPEGFRLIRCAIGDGAVPFLELETVLAQDHGALTASLEPGALQARHVKLLTDEWWDGYPPRSKLAKQACLEATKPSALDPEEDWRTPAERGEDSDSVSRFEMEQMMKSVENMQSIGWLPS